MSDTSHTASSHERDAKLGRALGRESAAGARAGSCLTPGQIAGCAEGTLDPAGRDAAMTHLAACGDCRAKFLLTRSLLPEMPAAGDRRQGRRRWGIAAGVALAAGLALLIVRIQPQNGSRENVATVPDNRQAGDVTSVPARVAVTPRQKPPVGLSESPVATVQLMTDEEAALPERKQQLGFAGAPADTGPAILIRKPGDGVSVAAGFPLVIQFSAATGRTIDPGSIRLVCLKQPLVDLTPRIRPYASEKGVSIDRVTLPPGLYRLRVSLADSRGDTSEREFSLTVTGRDPS